MENALFDIKKVKITEDIKNLVFHKPDIFRLRSKRATDKFTKTQLTYKQLQ